MRSIVFGFLLLTLSTVSNAIFAQDNSNTSTIYFYRPKNFFASGCSARIKIGNQEFFNINNGECAEYKLHSIGKISVTTIVSCNGQGNSIVINVESGKSYYVHVDASKFNHILTIDDEEGYKKKYDASKAIPYEEDIRTPINSSLAENTRKHNGGQGTCFLIASGYLMTNYHCVEGAKEVTVKGIDGDFTTKYGATVVATDPTNDLALIKISNKNLKFEALPSQLRTSGVAQGEKVYALGFPTANVMGSEVKITDGIISAKSGAQGDISKFQISAAVSPGNSGGPLIDEQGNIIGLIYAKSTVAENAGYAIKASYIDVFLKDIDGFELPTLNNTMREKSLTEKFSEWKKYVFIVETN